MKLYREYDLVIIDNLTNILNNSQDFESGKDFMEEVKRLKDLYGTTVLRLAHVTKGIKTLNSDSMAGAKVLSNYADDMIGLAKVRNRPTEDRNYVYGKLNVVQVERFMIVKMLQYMRLIGIRIMVYSFYIIVIKQKKNY